jgi:integrase
VSVASGLRRPWSAVDRGRAPWLRPFIILAIETGMRRGELLAATWDDLDVSARLVRVAKSKNGRERVVPLTPLAAHTLSSMPRLGNRVFPLTAYAVRQAWVRLVRRASIDDLRLHDLRHEAVRRFFEIGLTAPEVALISGHQDIRMLMRYTHLRPGAIATKLAVLSGDEPPGIPRES